MTTLDDIRHLFDIPDDVTYLNCAYMGPLSHPVREAFVRGASRKTRPWEIEVADFFEPVERARELFARIIGADADGVALVPSVSYGLAVAAKNLRPSERVVVIAEQFPSNVYVWRETAKVVTVPRPQDGDRTRALCEGIDERTSVVAVPNVHWADGSLVDLERVGEAARANGAALVVDGTQSIGAMPFDVAAIRPDVVVAASYKWLLGPYASALLWVAPHLRDGEPIEFNWIARDGAEDFAGLVDYTDAYRAGARRYDVGEVSNFAVVPALVAALEQTIGWGVANIAEHVEALTARIAAGAEEAGLEVLPRHQRGPHMLGVRLRTDPHEAARALAEARVHVSVRGDAVRVSPHVYNTADDADRLLDVLGRGSG